MVADVEREFGRRIRAQRTDDGDYRPLDRFLRNLRQKGITRWWNDLKDHQKPSPDGLIESLGPESSHQSLQKWLNNPDPQLDDPLGDMGMSDVACSGAIEEPAVRDAIVRTVDGGEEAFRLRRRKYGF